MKAEGTAGRAYRMGTGRILVLFLVAGPFAVWFSPAAAKGTDEKGPSRRALLASAGTGAHALLVYSALGESEKADALWPDLLKGFLEGRVERAGFLQAALQYFSSFVDSGRFEEAGALVESLRTKAPEERFFRLFELLLLEAQGRSEEAYRITGEFFDYYNEKLFPLPKPDPVDLSAVARAVFRENPDSAKRAFKLLAGVSAEMPDFIPARWFAAEIALERYHWNFARTSLEKLTSDFPFLAGAFAALAHLDLMESKYALAEKHARRALELNPRMARAYGVLAKLAFSEENTRKALDYAGKALAIDPFEITALAVRLAVEGRDPRAEGVLDGRFRSAVGSRLADLFHEYAEMLAVRRRFREAVGFERAAAKANPFDWRPFYGAGVNLLRLGEERKALAVLQKSFDLNPFNVWCYNLLEVLDRDYKEGELARLEGDGFLLKLPAREAPVYGRHLVRFLNGVFREYEKRWGIRAKGPRDAPGPLVEILPDHEDFSVRSVGLPNLGALGVCFGQVVLAPSPQVLSKRFHAAYSVILRHELSHAFTLQKSDYNIPRWLTEGIAMHDEGFPDYDWDRMLLFAVSEGVDTSILRLNRYFGRPSGRRDVELAYAVSYFTLGWIRSTWGEETVEKMVTLYGRFGPAAHERVIKEALGLGLEEFEKRKTAALRRYVRENVPLLPPVSEPALERASRTLEEKPDNLEARVTMLRGKWAAGQMDEVRRELPELYRSHPDDPVLAGLLGQLLLEDGEAGKALSVLKRSLRPGKERFWNLFLAGIAAGRSGDAAGAVSFLSRAETAMPHYVFPDNPSGKPLRRLLAGYLVELGKDRAASDVLRRQISSTGADIESARMLRSLAVGTGDRESLRIALDYILGIDPFDGQARLERAGVLRESGLAADAYYEFKAAAVLLDDAVEALQGWVETGLDLFRSGRLPGEEAERLLDATRMLRAKAPSDPLLRKRSRDIMSLRAEVKKEKGNRRW